MPKSWVEVRGSYWLPIRLRTVSFDCTAARKTRSWNSDSSRAAPRRVADRVAGPSQARLSCGPKDWIAALAVTFLYVGPSHSTIAFVVCVTGGLGSTFANGSGLHHWK